MNSRVAGEHKGRDLVCPLIPALGEFSHILQKGAVHLFNLAIALRVPHAAEVVVNAQVRTEGAENLAVKLSTMIGHENLGRAVKGDPPLEGGSRHRRGRLIRDGHRGQELGVSVGQNEQVFVALVGREGSQQVKVHPLVKAGYRG